MGTVAAVAAALELARSARARVLLASAGRDGRPHLTTVGSLESSGSSAVEATAWYCHQTVVNVGENAHVAVLVQADDRAGFLLDGEVTAVREGAMLDGWDPALEERGPVPQVQRTLRIDVRRVLPFADRAHTDTPL